MNRREVIIIFIVLMVTLLALWQIYSINSQNSETFETVDIIENQPSVVEDSSVFIQLLPLFSEVFETEYYSYIIASDNPVNEVKDLVGEENFASVLALNRINASRLKTGTELIIPDSFDNPNWLVFMPKVLKSAKEIPKLVIVHQPLQSFGAYEYGELVRSGSVSTGKESTPTPAGLYHMNWRGERVISSVDDEWILHWNINIDNKRGVALHQYVLPGYPDSHSCVRLYASDAKWLYHWGDSWELSANGSKVVEHGTPVIIYGEYDFDSPAPWKLLPENPDAMDVDVDELEKAVRNYFEL